MKIEKLHTLSQFIDKIQNRRYQKYLEFYNDYNEFSLSNLGLIFRYNEFLKRPINRSMFLNPNGLEPPKCLDKCDGYFEADFERWEKAESGVIFKGWNASDVKHPDYLTLGDGSSIELNDSVWYFESKELLNYVNVGVKTLADLAEVTNGMLQTKNITL